MEHRWLTEIALTLILIQLAQGFTEVKKQPHAKSSTSTLLTGGEVTRQELSIETVVRIDVESESGSNGVLYEKPRTSEIIEKMSNQPSWETILLIVVVGGLSLGLVFVILVSWLYCDCCGFRCCRGERTIQIDL